MINPPSRAQALLDQLLSLMTLIDPTADTAWVHALTAAQWAEMIFKIQQVLM